MNKKKLAVGSFFLVMLFFVISLVCKSDLFWIQEKQPGRAPNQENLNGYFPVVEMVKKIQVKNNQWINWVASSHDGAVMAAATYKPNEAGNYDYYLISNTGDVVFKDTYESFLGGVFWVTVSGDGRFSASGGLKQRLNDDEIGFIKAYYNYEKVLDSETEGRVNAVALSNEGKYLLVGAGKRNKPSEVLSLYEYDRNKYIKIDSISREKGCRSIAFSDVGDIAVCGRFDGIVEIFRIANKKLNKVLHYKLENSDIAKTIRFVNITPDGRWVVASGNDGYFYLFNVNDENKSPGLAWKYKSTVGNEVYGVAISPDGSFVSAGSSDGVETGDGKKVLQIIKNNCIENQCKPEPYWEFIPDRSPNPGMSFDFSGRYLSLATGFPVGTNGSFYLFDIKNKKSIFHYTADNMNWPLTISRDGRHLIGGSDDSNIYLFKINNQ